MENFLRNTKHNGISKLEEEEQATQFTTFFFTFVRSLTQRVGYDDGQRRRHDRLQQQKLGRNGEEKLALRCLGLWENQIKRKIKWEWSGNHISIFSYHQRNLTIKLSN